MEDYYKLIGTSREAVSYTDLKGRRRTEEEIDKFLRGKFKDKIKSIETKKQIATSIERINELNQEIEKVTFAYEQIKSSELRKKYNQEFNSVTTKTIENNQRQGRTLTAYDILRTPKETIQRRSDEENDSDLMKKRDQLLDGYSKMLEDSRDFYEKARVKFKIQRIKQAWELVQNAEKRSEYDKRLKREQIERRYSHCEEYNPDLVDSRDGADSKLLKDKIIGKRKIKGKEYSYLDEAGRNIRIAQTGQIAFKTLAGYIAGINEYQVKRTIDGCEKEDTIYTDLNMGELSVNKNTGEPYNSEYYDCVVNELLSEEVIEGSRYNSGYIGRIEKDENNEYYITLGKEKLMPAEQEELTAVIIISNLEKEKNNEREER